VSQGGAVQWPSLQKDVAPVHALPHPPQFCGSLVGLMHVAPQQVSNWLQAGEHALPPELPELPLPLPVPELEPLEPPLPEPPLEPEPPEPLLPPPSVPPLLPPLPSTEASPLPLPTVSVTPPQ
jgi:hypothetical protein